MALAALGPLDAGTRSCRDDPARPLADTIAACRTASSRGDLASTLVLGDALVQNGAPAEAHAVITAVLPRVSRGLRGDALAVLGAAEARTGRADLALARFLEARALHLFHGARAAAARDLYATVVIYYRRSMPGHALDTLARAMDEAHASGDARVEGLTVLGVARVMADVGDVVAAERAHARASKLLAPFPQELAWVKYALGALYHETARRPGLAVPPLRDAIRLAQGRGLRDLERSAWLHLASALLQLGRPAEAEDALAASERVDPGTRKDGRWVLARARLDIARGKTDQARALLEPFAVREIPGDWAWQARMLLFGLAEARGDRGAQETLLREAISMVELLRARAGVPELRSFVLRERREPHEALFALLAGQGRDLEALAVAESLHARSALERIAGAEAAFGSLRETAATLDGLVPLLRTTPDAKLRAPATVFELVGDRELILHVVARGRVHGVHVEGGRVAVRDLGDAKAILRLVDELAANPGARAAAEELGALLFRKPPVNPTWCSGAIACRPRAEEVSDAGIETGRGASSDPTLDRGRCTCGGRVAARERVVSQGVRRATRCPSLAASALGRTAGAGQRGEAAFHARGGDWESSVGADRGCRARCSSAAGTRRDRRRRSRAPGPCGGESVIALPSTVRVYAAASPTDLRKGFDALAIQVRETLALDPLSGHLFLFFNRGGNRAKVLFFTETGYYLVFKRLERGRFQLPRPSHDGRYLQLDAAELALILEGADLRHASRPRPWRPQRSETA